MAISVRNIKNFVCLARHSEDRAMAQAVSRRPLTAKDQDTSQVCPFGICGGRNSTCTGSFLNTSVFSLLLSFDQCSIRIHPPSTKAVRS
jgi:hypothetical protein